MTFYLGELNAGFCLGQDTHSIEMKWVWEHASLAILYLQNIYTLRHHTGCDLLKFNKLTMPKHTCKRISLLPWVEPTFRGFSLNTRTHKQTHNSKCTYHNPFDWMWDALKEPWLAKDADMCSPYDCHIFVV